MENRHQKDREWERLLRESLSEEKPEKQEMIVQNNLLRARMAGSASCTEPAAGSAGHLPVGAKSSAGAVGSGDSDRRQSNRLYPDPVGCADVRFKKQADLVYRAMRRKRDVLVLSLSWDGDSGSAAVDCRCVHLGLSGCKGARRTRLAVGADYLDFIAVAGWSGLSDCPQGGAQTLPLLRVDAGKGFPLLQPLWQAVPLL